jgi:hypothetical protein
MNEVRERFLKAILEQLPAERIAEIHFFPSIRNGQVETGAAVIGTYPEQPETEERHVIHTASYRLTRKGPDRGKWEVDIVAQADAPLPTVDLVVRGVQQRSGDEIESLRITAQELQAILNEPLWQTAP